MVLAIILQFNSLRRTLLTFLTIPLILVGIPYGLLATGQPLSFFGTLGIRQSRPELCASKPQHFRGCAFYTLAL
jgi:hypothetical protein